MMQIPLNACLRTAPCWTGLMAASNLWLTVLVLMYSAGAEVFTSSEKLARLSHTELRLFDRLRSYHTAVSLPRQFLKRLRTLSRLPYQQAVEQSLHPNGVYLMIEAFLHTWPALLAADPGFWTVLADDVTVVPTRADSEGVLSAILRLQRVYRLSVTDIYTGNYSGFMGPGLSLAQLYPIGRQAFVEGLLRESISWLELADAEDKRCRRAVKRGEGGEGRKNQRRTANRTSWMTVTSDNKQSKHQRAAMLGLLGRAHYHVGQRRRALILYHSSVQLDSDAGDVRELGKELWKGQPPRPVHMRQPWHVKMNCLCSRPAQHTVARLRPYHRCHYRRSLSSPYVRYKQEVLSLQPYITIFHDVISDHEIKTIKNYVLGKMTRGRVQDRRGKQFVLSHERVSEISWIHDTDLRLADRLSKRVKEMTWLEVSERLPHGPISAEGFQVINYGVGGHHNSHYDPVQVFESEEIKRSGNRLATLVIYLTDVEIGGHTVFLRKGLSVAPRKGTALFWYNYNPAMTLESLTLHAGCPVLKGHKWIANKWIWTYGNTFRRPCSTTPHCTQRQLEATVMSSLLNHH